MFNDLGILEFVTLVVLAVLVFGPDKLPKVIQDVSRFIRKIREFSDSAKNDIRSELGPDFKDFEFEDLNPKTFLRKQMESNEDLRELKELRGGLDLRKEMNEIADAVHGRDPDSTPPSVPAAVNGCPNLLKEQDEPGTAERPPYDSDAT
ncbi:sec-independent translocase [Streptomyces sp. NPDC057101]|uniref:sec-independent translocase n=1 Tax=Streptomyces sp. NPDC057101 TaxID=3346020 RepID=UPI00362BF364